MIHPSKRPTLRRPTAAARARGDSRPLGAGTNVLPLVARLAEELAAAGVRYCHWKSNEALDRSLSGENDLDLLVAREDLDRFREVLARLGFKDVRPPRAKELPGVFQAYGLDPSGRLVNVHAHVQLVVGDDTTKNVRLPMERAFLASAGGPGPLPVPAPELEYVAFTLRMVLKHATWDAVAMLRGALAASERRELAFLEARVDPERARAVVREHLPWVDDDLWARCVAAVRPGASVLARVRAARRLLRAARDVARRPLGIDAALRVSRRVGWAARKLILRRRSRKRLARGGALVAVVGGDGAGKSTTVEHLVAWLGRVFACRRVHLGKPPRSLLTWAFKGPVALVRRFGPLSGTRVQAFEIAEGRAPADPGLAWFLWQVLTARDRVRAHRRARRRAARGEIVVCDRYPLPSVRYMDGCRTAALGDLARFGRLPRALAALERRLYDRIPPPDVLVVLRVDPDVAVARKPDERPGFVRPRSAEIYDLDWTGTGALVVDAGRPQDEVLAEVRAGVWARL
jgi:thymidylate kinase